MGIPVRVEKTLDEFGRLIKEEHSDGFVEETTYNMDGTIHSISTWYPNGYHEFELYGSIPA